MENTIELLLIVVIAVGSTTLLYRMLPFRSFGGNKPIFTLFPKYIASLNKSISYTEAKLDELKFEKVSENKYSRGKIYGDFTANSIKLIVELDKKNNQLKIYSGFFGVLFDTGDIWSLTADIINE